MHLDNQNIEKFGSSSKKKEKNSDVRFSVIQ
jgi:hypothetical protein